jgi:hypothetical protein
MTHEVAHAWFPHVAKVVQEVNRPASIGSIEADRVPAVFVMRRPRSSLGLRGQCNSVNKKPLQGRVDDERDTRDDSTYAVASK